MGRFQETRRISPLTIVGIVVWAAAAGLTLLVALVWLLLLSKAESAVQEAALSAAGAFVVISLYVVVRAADKVLAAVGRVKG